MSTNQLFSLNFTISNESASRIKSYIRALELAKNALLESREKEETEKILIE